jgi:hypothetical protein
VDQCCAKAAVGHAFISELAKYTIESQYYYQHFYIILAHEQWTATRHRAIGGEPVTVGSHNSVYHTASV